MVVSGSRFCLRVRVRSGWGWAGSCMRFSRCFARRLMRCVGSWTGILGVRCGGLCSGRESSLGGSLAGGWLGGGGVGGSVGVSVGAAGGEGAGGDGVGGLLDGTQWAQPALFAVEVALFR